MPVRNNTENISKLQILNFVMGLSDGMQGGQWGRIEKMKHRNTGDGS